MPTADFVTANAELKPLVCSTVNVESILYDPANWEAYCKAIEKQYPDLELNLDVVGNAGRNANYQLVVLAEYSATSLVGTSSSTQAGKQSTLM